MYSKYLTLLFIALSAVFFSSCSKEKPIDISLDNPESINPDLHWALINEPFVAFRNDSDFDSEVSSHGRLGDVEKIIGVFRKKERVWYRFSKGWLDADCLIVYDTQLKALSKSKELLNK
ncbi:hypothetical protein [Treponema sp.]|uniref:hypothetical protein n=1 Tax=Treponema sp. TaxID=166 RepID=UPI0025DA20F0|nr:hypothetical protein [Treponema sp.]MCR5219233.1 hypothetical protein [Treponema sp.]